jgi:hypothetical protein
VKSCPHCGLPLGEEPFDPIKEFFPQSESSVTTHWHDTRFTFGKYHGDTVQSVLRKNPGYISWVKDNVDYVTCSNEVLDELYQALAMEEQERHKSRYGRYYDHEENYRGWADPDDMFDPR